MSDGGGLTFQATSTMDIINRLESHNEHTESAEARQLRKDAAARIRELEHQVSELENQVRRARSDKMSRRSA